jgi:4-amino-4-deoxy-L-arabinose transferase-like glycosyltransferase
VLIGCFPASLLIFRFRNREQKQEKALLFRKMMIASLLVILIVFTIVKTKIVHYSSFTYLPIGYLAASTIYGVIHNSAYLKKWQELGLLVLGLIWSALFIALPLIGNNIEWIRPLLSKDAFALANTQALVKWNTADVLPGVLFLGAVIISFVWIKQQKYQKAFILLIFSSIAAIQVLLTLFTPRIEQYSQHAAIEFFKSLKDQKVYVKTLGYKSYAQYFYARVRPGNNVLSKDESWLLTGAVDRPVYFVSKNTYTRDLMNVYGTYLEILYEKNGYVFYRRK